MSYFRKEFITICLMALTFFSNTACAKESKKLDFTAEVIAKEVFGKMRIKFKKESLKIVKDELKLQKVPQHFLKYFSCKESLITYSQIKTCLKNKPNKKIFDLYTTSVSQAITNLHSRGLVAFLL
jgi:hypothetical protein